MTAAQHRGQHQINHLLLPDETAVDGCLGRGQLFPKTFDPRDKFACISHDFAPRAVI
jgi:hypothetical protein